jgi:predicted chitinase
MKRLITEDEEKNIKQMHSMDEGMLSDLIDKVKSSDTVQNIKKKFEDLFGVKLGDDDKEDTDDGGEYTGSVEYTGGGMDSDQKKNMGLILKALESAGVTDPKSQIGILSVIKKESNFKLGDEIGYCSTSDSRIESIFGARGKKCKSMKCNDKEFFDCLYGYKSGVNLGNTEPGDGYKYLGRGFHGLTGKANYKKYGISDPESLNDDPKVAAKEVADFFKPHVKDFDSVEDAVTEMNRINSGGSQFGLSKALEASSGFNVK